MSEALPDHDFSELLERVKWHTSDKDRIRLIKATTNESKFTSKQVLQLLQSLSFETAKIEAGVLLYNHVVDPENYAKEAIDPLRYKDEKEKIKKALNL
ncbi:hypothetical protein M0811_12768 [Anaeramoeba ignava]|uniref:DUF4476 domain-containing protein n=1 Tax=Anaeramoeba ignava TaxID=1746090 RepID=A0A9Q0R672_ANAIG|nr:hypothetical protein M0811_12768 [Anaeramoeba ignava]